MPAVVDVASLSYPLAGTPFQAQADYARRYEAAWQALQAGRSDEARLKLRDFLKSPPAGTTRRDLYPVQAGFGFVELTRGHDLAAEERFIEALGLRSDYASAHEGLARVAERRGDYAHAVTEMESAAAGDAEAFAPKVEVLRVKAAAQALARAVDLRVKGTPEEALKACDQAIAFAPREPQAYRERAAILESSEDWEGAAGSYRKLSELAPQDPEAWVRLASALSKAGRRDEAREALEKAAKLPGGEAAAKEVYQRVRAADRAAAGVGELARVAEADEIDRAGLAALLATELPMLERARHDRRVVVSDVYNSWARAYIQEAVALGLMEVYDNHTFRPTDRVSRQELAHSAAAVTRLMRASGWISEKPYAKLALSDVPAFHIARADIEEAMRYGVMALAADASFHPDAAVSGPEAKRVVVALARLVR